MIRAAGVLSPTKGRQRSEAKNDGGASKQRYASNETPQSLENAPSPCFGLDEHNRRLCRARGNDKITSPAPTSKNSCITISQPARDLPYPSPTHPPTPPP